MEEQKKISINIAGRHYPVVVNSKEEVQLRKLENEIKTKLVTISTNYPKLDTQDYLALILMEMSTIPNDLDANNPALQSIIQKVKSHLEE